MNNGKSRPVTFGMIVGNRGFFPGHLAQTGRTEMLAAIEKAGYGAVTVGADETVLAAYQRMKLYDVSQLPVMRAGRIVGIVDEENILLRVYDNEDHFRQPVTAGMASGLVTVPPDASVERLMEIFNRGMVAIVTEGDEFLGLITRIDLLNWLRRRMQG